jgi:hypothetical protein
VEILRPADVGAHCVRPREARPPLQILSKAIRQIQVYLTGAYGAQGSLYTMEALVRCGSVRQIGICLTDYHFDSHKFFCCQQLSHFWRLQWQPVQ